MKCTRLGMVAAVLVARAGLHAGEMTEELARELFIDVETIARSPEKEQVASIPRLYREAFPVLDRSRLALAWFDFAFLKDAEKRKPEELAEAVLADKRAGWPWLVEMARERCIELLRRHRDTLRPLVEADLKGGDDAAKARALHTLGEAPMGELFDLVLAVFQGGGELSEPAAYTLRDLRDPRAIPHLIAKDPKRPTHYFELLRGLQRGRPADPALVRLLVSESPEVRWHAAYALAESGDPSLIPHMERLVKDAEPHVRKYAANIAFCLPKEAFPRARPALLPLLADRDADVRVFVAVCLAQRKDKACAKALLDLIQDESIGELPHSNVWQAIQNLTGTYFGYYHGSDGWRPTTPVNQAAIARFAAWVRENAAD